MRRAIIASVVFVVATVFAACAPRRAATTASIASRECRDACAASLERACDRGCTVVVRNAFPDRIRVEVTGAGDDAPVTARTVAAGDSTSVSVPEPRARANEGGAVRFPTGGRAGPTFPRVRAFYADNDGAPCQVIDAAARRVAVSCGTR